MPPAKRADKMPVCAPGQSHSLRRAVRGVDGGKTDDCDGHDAGAINRAPTVALCHRRGAIYCALIGYIQGWGRKRGTTNALHPTAQSAPQGALFYGIAGVPPAQPCGQDARAPGLTNSLRPRLRRRLHVAAHVGGFRLRLPKLRFGFPSPPPTGRRATVWAQFIAP